jgi:hypothetical protein
MSFMSSLRNRVLRLEQARPPSGVIGIVLRPGMTQAGAQARVRAAASSHPGAVVYVANLGRYRL